MKIFLFGLLTVAVVVLVGFGIKSYLSEKSTETSNSVRMGACFDEKMREMDCDKCVKKGEILEHSFMPTCEIKARDAGDRCTYNDECDKGRCVYENREASRGECIDFRGREGSSCTRERGKSVSCFIEMS